MVRVLAELGLSGLEALRDKVAVLVIVDVLSFSTAIDVAMSRGAAVYPFSSDDKAGAQAAADRVGAVLAQTRGASGGQFSLSPASLLALPVGTRLMLPSPNGSKLSLACCNRLVLAGCLRNAAAVARAAQEMANEGAIGVIPAGERWPDGSLRPAIEDLLGAGAVIQHLALPCSPEAQVARDAFRTAGEDAARLIRTSVSGQELVDRGFTGDVDLATETDTSPHVPVLTGGAYRAA